MRWRPSLCASSGPEPPGRLAQRPEHQPCDQRLLNKTAGAWLPFGIPALDRFSKNGVGRTGFEPVTSSVSGNFGVSVTVGLSSSGEPLTCQKILATSRWVWGRLNTLAPISGSHDARRAGFRSKRQAHRGLSGSRADWLSSRGWTGGLPDARSGEEWSLLLRIAELEARKQARENAWREQRTCVPPDGLGRAAAGKRVG